jgi:hypothetical protein
VIHRTTGAGTIAGGCQNTIEKDADGSAIGGGDSNTIQADTHSGSISGGEDNTIEANAWQSTIGGGRRNTIRTNAWQATIPGGQDNLAEGNFCLAAGRRAKAHGAGSFVWGDSQDFDVHAWSANQFVVRATGGYWLFSGVDGGGNPTSGAILPAGSGSWDIWSDRNAKTNCVAADTKTVLEKVLALPLATWNYQTQDPSIRHLGPMAQDFHAAFGLGTDDKHISTVDADGVALAAIQGLNQKVEDRCQKFEGKSQRLQAENESLKKEVAELKALVKVLAAKVDSGGQ